MSNREKCHEIIDSFTENQLMNIAGLLNSVKALADETSDDAYCLRLFDDYRNNADKGEPVGIEDFSKQLRL